MEPNLAFVPIEEGTRPCGRSLVTKMKALVGEESGLYEKLVSEALE
jgi:hypothetical protein